MERTGNINLPQSDHPLEALPPLDLRAGFGDRQVLDLAFEAVALVDWPVVSTAPAYLRTLLTYSFCIGFFSSRDIEGSISLDPTLRYICGNDRPRWQILRQFRRQHTESLKAAIAHVIAGVEKALGSAPCSYIFLSAGRFAQTGSPTSARLEAERRLLLAIQADSAAMDD